MHIKCNHGLKRILMFWATAIVFDKLDSFTNYHDASIKRKLHSQLFNIIGSLVFYKYSRMCEKEADIEAAKSMHSNTGCIELFNKIKDAADPDSKFMIKRSLGKLINPIMYYLYGSHPTFHERIHYLEALQLEQNS